MASIIPGGININAGNWIVEAVYWLGIALIIIIILSIFAVIAYWISYPYKVTVFPMYGSGKDGIFSIAKRKYNKIRWNKSKTAWIKMFPVFKTEEVEPFDSEYIYPGNQLYAFDLNGVWQPGRVNIKQTEDEIRSEINPVPYYVRNWQSLQHKKHAIEFAEHNWWDDNKAWVYMLIAVVACCVLCGATVYLTYKYAAPSREMMTEFTKTLKDFAMIPGK